jgi:transcriptional regulator with XRE-family HTH domain
MSRRIKKTHSKIVSNFAKQLRRFRKKRGLSQMRLSANSGVALSFLGRLERSEAEPGLEMCYRLAAALDVPLSRLLRDDKMGDETETLRKRARESIETAIVRADAPILEMLTMLGSVVHRASRSSLPYPKQRFPAR